MSVKELFHYVEIYSSGIFRQYDYLAPAENVRRYGSDAPVIPPPIDLSKIGTFADNTVPIVMYVGK